jgi:V/A-type H+-transporting ATPase subunit E
MSADAIIERIRADAEEEARRIRDRAEDEARSIIAAAGREGEEEYSRVLGEGRRETRVLTGRILAQASIDARRLVREEKEKGVASCFAEAEKALHRLAQSGEYRQILKNLIAGGLRELGADEIVLVATERDHDLVAGIITEPGAEAPRITLNPECAITAGGVILRSKSGKVTVNNTFEARMERFQDDLIFSIARILYGRE